jgi:DNA repair exonuclease SbcCD ATPase subunit
MNIARTAVHSTFVLVLVACGSSQKSDVRSAEAELTAARQEAQQDMAELERRQAREQAEAQRDKSAAERSELRSEHEAERLEQYRESQEDITEATRDLEGERASLQNERNEFRAESRERLTKLDAKASEARRKSTRLAATRRGDFDARWQAYTVKRNQVDQSLAALPRASDADWTTNRDRVQEQLDALEEAVDDLDDAL